MEDGIPKTGAGAPRKAARARDPAEDFAERVGTSHSVAQRLWSTTEAICAGRVPTWAEASPMHCNENPTPRAEWAGGGEAATGSCSPPAKKRRMRVALEPQCRVAKVQCELQGMKAEQLCAMSTVWGDHWARWAARVGLSEKLEEKH